MRHKYSTTALVLSRTPIAEAGMLVTLLTHDLGLIRARAEGVRRQGAKLAHALQTLREVEVMLVRGKDGWRLSGAVLTEDLFKDLTPEGRMRAARVASLLLRLVHGETADKELFDTFIGFIRSLPGQTEEEQDAAECLAALSLLRILGLDSGEVPLVGSQLSPLERRDIVTRVNRGILASGL